MSIWHSPTPIIGSWRGPPRIALLKKSVRNGLAVDKMVGQLGLPNGVKSLMRRSRTGDPVGSPFGPGGGGGGKGNCLVNDVATEEAVCYGALIAAIIGLILGFIF
jgi:hypothetical protein